MELEEDSKLPFLDCLLKRVMVCLLPLCTENYTDTEQEKGSILTIPYIAGLSKV